MTNPLNEHPGKGGFACWAVPQAYGLNVQSSDSGAKESRHIYIYMENTGKEDNNIELN